jgi:hypothetical protein
MSILLEDANIVPKRDQMLVEPIRETRLSILHDIIDLNTSVPATIKAKVIKFGELTREPDFLAGDIVVIIPHAGTLMPMLDPKLERLIIPISAAIGVWDE